MLETLKIVAAFLCGGAGGALITEFFRRKNSRLQKLSLIERANRVVKPGLQGVTLARVVEMGTTRSLEELQNVREYQFTLRNTTSSIHLQNIDVQFEFPATDVEAWTSRPSLSKTALVAVDVSAIEPWQKVFRWTIPYFPAGDSVEFTFQAVNPSSDKYEVALYKSDRVIIQKVIGEPAPDKQFMTMAFVGTAAICTIGIIYLYYDINRLQRKTTEQLSSFFRDSRADKIYYLRPDRQLLINGNDRFIAVVNLPIYSFNEYRIDLIDERGRIRFSVDNAYQSPPQQLIFSIPGVESGIYKLVVFGTRNAERREKQAEYSLRVVTNSEATPSADTR